MPVTPLGGQGKRDKNKSGNHFRTQHTIIALTAPGDASLRSIERGSTAIGALIRMRVFRTDHDLPTDRVGARET